MSIKIPCSFQVKIAGSCAMSGRSFEGTSGCPAVSKSFIVEDVRTSEQHRSDARSSFSNFYMELDFNQHCLGSLCKTSGRRGNTSEHCPTFQNILDFLFEPKKELQRRPSRRLAKSFGRGLVMEKLRYSGRRSQKTVWTRLTSVRTLNSQSLNLSIFRFSVSL
jgi:hypothetical protein